MTADGTFRVLALTNMYPPHHYGGYETQCRDVLERFAARGHTVEVMTSDLGLGPNTEPEVTNGVRVDRGLRLAWRDHELMSPPPLERFQMERRNQRVVVGALDRFLPDVVSIWNPSAMSLSALRLIEDRGTAIVLVVCDDWFVHAPLLDPWTRVFDRHRAARSVVRWVTGLETRLPQFANATACFVSSSIRDRARASGRWRCVEECVVHGGIDPSVFPTRHLADAEAFRWHLLSVGRLDPRKGHDTAIRALALLPRATLDIVGPGPETYRASLDDLAHSLGVRDRVRFSVVPSHEVAAHYGAADVCVFPSRWEEPFGLVPLEAMAVGTPVVATRRGGSAEFLSDDVNCLAFERDDHAALAAAVERLANDPALRARLVSGGRDTASKLTIDRYADDLEVRHRSAASASLGVPS